MSALSEIDASALVVTDRYREALIALGAAGGAEMHLQPGSDEQFLADSWTAVAGYFRHLSEAAEAVQMLCSALGENRGSP